MHDPKVNCADELASTKVLKTVYTDHRLVEVTSSAVWREVFPLDRFLRVAPEAVDYQVFADGHRAFAQTHFGVGSIRWNVFAELQVDVAEAPNHLQLSGSAPSMRLEFVGVLDIESIRTDCVTLRYNVRLECGRGFLSRLMKHALVGALEDHVVCVLERASEAAIKHTEATRRLSGPG